MAEDFVYEWRAVGVHCRVVSSAPLALDALVQQVETWEQTLSRFRPDSELNRLNRQRRMRVSPTLHAVLLAAREVAQWSNGLVVPSLGQHISASGYDRTFAAVPTNQPEALTRWWCPIGERLWSMAVTLRCRRTYASIWLASPKAGWRPAW